MLSGKYRGTEIGSGTNTWSMSEDLRAGKITLAEFHEAESCMNRSHGHCMTMGTASTMASMVETPAPILLACYIRKELVISGWQHQKI